MWQLFTIIPHDIFFVSRHSGIVNSMMKIYLGWDRALSNSNVCRNRKQSKNKGFSVRKLPPITFLTYYQEYRKRYFFTQGGQSAFQGFLVSTPFFFWCLGLRTLSTPGLMPGGSISQIRFREWVTNSLQGRAQQYQKTFFVQGTMTGSEKREGK